MDFYEFITEVGGFDNLVVSGSGPTPPTAPSNLVDDGSSGAVAALAWENNGAPPDGDYTTVRVEQKVGAGAFSQVDSLAGAANFWSSPDLSDGSYVFRVRGEIAGVFSAYSNELPVTIPA